MVPTLCPVLVGRADLLALADRRLRAAADGSGELLILAGEAGIGKTRLLSAIRERATDLGFTTFGVGAYPRDTEVSGGVLSDLAAELSRREMPVGVKIADRLNPDRPTADRRAADRPAADKPRADRTIGEDATIVADDPYRYRRMIVADVAEALAGVEGPALIALEDLHWADDLTLDVLERLARRLPTVPILVVATYRSDELYPKVPTRTWRTRLLTQRLAEEARLTRLGADETAAMASAMTDVVLPEAVLQGIFARSDGIPLHVEEFMAIAMDPAVTDVALPDTLADAVLARAQLLSPAARTLAGAASVIGRSFDVDLLTGISDASPDDIDAALRELTDRFFVQPGTDDSPYDFRHALIRDALYGDLPPHRRRHLHAKVAEAAAAAGFRDAFVSDHYERAGRPAEAYRYALAAATEASAISAHREAVELYRRVQRTTPNDVPAKDRAAMLTALAGELAAIDDNSAAAATYAEAYERLLELGDRAGAADLMPNRVAVYHLLGADLARRTGLLQEALALIDDVKQATPTKARILAALAAAYMLDRRLDESISYGEQARALAAGSDDQITRINTDATLGSVLVFAGRFDEGWRILEEAIGEARTAHLEAEAARAYRMIGSSASVLVEYRRARRWLEEGVAYAERTERFNDRHYMSAHLAHTLWATGDWTAATEMGQRALADGGGVTTRISALHVLGYLALGRGDWAEANRQLHEARVIGEEMRELQRLSPALWGLAEVALHSGQPGEAITWCLRAYEESAAVRDAAYLFPFVVTGTRAYLARDALTGARHWFERCADLLRLRSIPGTLPALDHARGLLYLAEGQTGKAREALANASEGWDTRQRFWEGVQAINDQARATNRAIELRAEARRRARAAGATILLAEESADEPLTTRELEVARLVATGATNREIAAALFISPKTVAAHVEHIFAKLGAGRRAEIAVWVKEHARPG